MTENNCFACRSIVESSESAICYNPQSPMYRKEVGPEDTCDFFEPQIPVEVPLPPFVATNRRWTYLLTDLSPK